MRPPPVSVWSNHVVPHPHSHNPIRSHDSAAAPNLRVARFPCCGLRLPRRRLLPVFGGAADGYPAAAPLPVFGGTVDCYPAAAPLPDFGGVADGYPAAAPTPSLAARQTATPPPHHSPVRPTRRTATPPPHYSSVGPARLDPRRVAALRGLYATAVTKVWTLLRQIRLMAACMPADPEASGVAQTQPAPGRIRSCGEWCRPTYTRSSSPIPWKLSSLFPRLLLLSTGQTMHPPRCLLEIQMLCFSTSFLTVCRREQQRTSCGHSCRPRCW